MSFTGSSDDAAAALVFLLREHPKQCTFILDDAKLSASGSGSTLASWEDVALVWANGDMQYPGRDRTEHGFLRDVRACREQFTVMPLILVDPAHTSLHANFIILDRREGTIEHFEPYGFMPQKFGHAEPLRTQLRHLCRKAFPTALPNGIVIEPRPSEGKGLQARQELEKKMARPDQPPGFCLAWSTLYASVRLASPLQRPEITSDRILELVRRSKDSTLTDFIDRFATSTVERKTRVRAQDQAGPEKGR